MVTEEELLDLFATEAIIDRAKLTRDAPLDEIGISSIDVLSVLFELEDRFKLEIAPEDLPTGDLGAILDFLLGQINQTHAADA